MRYVGEPPAIVVAADRYLAEDARGAVRVDIAPLPVMLDAGEVVQRDFGEPIDESVWPDTPVVVEARYRQAVG